MCAWVCLKRTILKCSLWGFLEELTPIIYHSNHYCSIIHPRIQFSPSPPFCSFPLVFFGVIPKIDFLQAFVSSSPFGEEPGWNKLKCVEMCAFPLNIFFPPLFSKLIYFLIEGELLYRFLVFSVKPQHEWAIGVHISLLS